MAPTADANYNHSALFSHADTKLAYLRGQIINIQFQKRVFPSLLSIWMIIIVQMQNNNNYNCDAARGEN